MSATGRGGATEPGRALRAPTTPGAVLAATDGGERVCFSLPARLSVWRVLFAAYPRPAALYRGPCPLRWVLRSWPPACPSALPAGANKGWTGLNRGTPGTRGPQCVTVTSHRENRSCPRGHRDEHRIH